MIKLKEQTEAKIAEGRSKNPKFMKGVDNIIAQAEALKKGAQAIKIGQKAPNFTLPDALGKQKSLKSFLKEGPLVITFYRGSWCPYCNLQLRAIQSKISTIKDLGATLVAISPEIPDESMTENEINKMDFTVLSDQNATIASQYGVAWEVPDFLLEHMRVDRNLDLKKINNGNSNILPIPATFVVDTDGTVIWNYVNVDYRTRSEPDEIIEVLKKLDYNPAK